jgi:predicted phosphohydrolase
VPRWFALADLHLSLSGHKPMDVFGELWRDHAARMASSWDATVGAGDVVLLAGDLSWGRNLSEAAPDLAWIGARPGRKVLLRGNHDSWWGKSVARVRAALPTGCALLHHDAHESDGRVVLGARGWTAPDDPFAQPGDEAVFAREVERLRLSVAEADRRFGRDLPRTAMTHYPPWPLGRPPGEVVAILKAAGVGTCVYGHLHGDDHALARTGTHEGIEFRFVAADAVGFTPVPIHEPARSAP